MVTHFEVCLPKLVVWVQRLYKPYIHPIAEKTFGVEVKSININDNTEFDEIRKVCFTFKEFLVPHFLVFNLPPQTIAPLHMDGYEDDRRRSLSMNIPISGCDADSVTEFFDCPPENFFGDKLRKTHWLKPGRSKGNKIGEYNLLSNPVIISPQVPHKITNKSLDKTRVSVSWTLKYEWSIEDAYNYFKNQNLIYS